MLQCRVHGVGSNGLVVGRQEDDLAVSSLGHGLHCLEVSDLHGRSRAQDIGRLSHEFGGFDFGTGSNDLGFTDSLGLSGHREGVLEVVAEDNVLYQHRFDLDTPARCDILDNFTNRLGKLLATLNDILQDTRSNNVSQGGLGSLHQGLTDVGDTKSRLVRRCNVIVDDRSQVECNIVLGHAHLTWHLDNLDLDIDLDESFGQWVDLDQTRVDSSRKATELGDQTHVTLRHRLVGVGADNAAGDGTQETNAASQGIDCAALVGAVQMKAQNQYILIDPYQPWVSASLSP